MDYPAAHRFTAGEPHRITVSTDGSRVFFLRSPRPERVADQLWFFDVATATEHLVFDPGGDRVDEYATDPAGRVAAIAVAGTLTVLADPSGRGWQRRGEITTGPVRDPRPDPTGRRVAYVSDRALRVLDLPTGRDELLAAEGGSIVWGVTDTVSEVDFGRREGYWWGPDGTTILAARVDDARVPRWHVHDPTVPHHPGATIAYPVAGAANAEVSLHLLDLDGGWVDVHWDRETYPYVVAVSWSEVGGPLVTVLRRLQQHGLVLAVDPRTGETQVHAELADPRWVHPVPGTPRYLPDGRVLIGGELAHDGFDSRCLFADGGLLTPGSLYVRRVCGRLGDDLLVEGSEGEPSEQHLFRVVTRSAGPGIEVRRITSRPGWHVGRAGGTTLVVGSATMDTSGTQWSVRIGHDEVARLRSMAQPMPYRPRPVLERVTDRRLPTGVLYPSGHVAGRRLPVLVDAGGGPGRQDLVAARAAWPERQWWAETGFAVVVVDTRGTPGVAPSFEKVIHRRLADMILTDQVDALEALAGKHADLDLSRVAIRGSRIGGWLAVLAALRRPDVYRCAIATAPIVDWTLYRTAFAERFLGLPGDAVDVYGHNSLLEDATEPAPSAPDARPMLLIHDLTDQDVLPAHTMRLSAALLHAGRPHGVIPVTGSDGSAALAPQLARLELDFLRHHL